MSRLASLRVLGVGAILASTIMFSGGSMALAQDSKVDPSQSHLAHVHKGTCATLDPAPQQNLNNVEPRKDKDGNVKTDPQGVLTSPQVLFSSTEVDMKLDDMLADAHAINVHKSAKEPMVYIACGDIGGTVIDDKLYIGLAPLNNSGFYGVATLEKDGDKTKIEIYLVEGKPGATEPNATPAA
ncbi:MAG: hypothetical protein ACR2OU_05170 [Thermomicrobiales bacterium]